MIQTQLKERDENMANKMKGILKENLEKEIAEKKKSVIIFGLEEKRNVKYRPTREKEEIKSFKDLLKNLNDEDRQTLEEVEEIHRMGPYQEGIDELVDSERYQMGGFVLGDALSPSENVLKPFAKVNYSVIGMNIFSVF
ncbi:hypothetical protein E2C01_088304 [Portunus trituberculatus]|uniref:Uncharacterized protein n=1 Tax=Portunus trituberculatus TaxID=210409 RepID=A0A5B7JAE0_PORTR|nr:hypothetical protein [Portunus trituberculatus]